MSGEAEYKVYGYRWVALAVFGLVLAVQNFLWLSFSPIEKSVQKALGFASNPTPIRILALVGPLMFVILGSTAGSISDRKGWKFGTAVGVVMITIAGVVKAITPHVASSGSVQYWIYLFMQTLGGAGSVFAMVNLSKMPVKWFPEDRRAMANGLTTMFLYLGMAIGFPLVNGIAGIPDNATIPVIRAGMNQVLLAVAIIMGVSAVLYFVLAREEPPTPAGPVPEVEQTSLRESFPRFMRSATFRALCVVSLVGYGVFIAMFVTMEKIITYHGIASGFTSSFASTVASCMIIGGIAGAAVIPGLSEKVGLRKPFLILAAAVGIPGTLLMGFVPSKPLGIIAALLTGFCLLPALPITFTIVGEMEEIGPRLAATAVGTVLALGSLGSVAVPLLMELFGQKKTADIVDYRWAIVFLAALVVIALVVILKYVRETGPKVRA